MADAYDVGVIGAGIHGASAAYHLASRGVRTVVFEKGAPAGGPTGRSSAVCRAYYTNEFLAEVARDSIRMFERFEEVTRGGSADFRRTGALFLHPAEEAEEVRRVAARLRGQGIPTEALTPDEILYRFPMFDLRGIGVGAWEEDAGYADPAGATAGLFRRAVELGATPRLGHPVVAIEPHQGRGGATIVAADGTRASCERILISAGPWTKVVAAQVGVDLPLSVERHIVGTFHWGGARPVPTHADLIGGYYFRPEGEDLFLVGPLHAGPNVDADAYPEGVGPDEVDDLAKRVVRRVPELERAEVHGGWASLYDVSPDWQPVIGEIASGIVVDAGTSGHGFKLAPALGSHVADLVVGEAWDPRLDQFHPRRFEEDRALGAGWGDAKILG